MISLLAFLVVTYTIFMAILLLGWLRMPETNVPAVYKSQTCLSVLVPVRNEASNILNLLQDLEKQHYPLSKFEVLILDDNSEDETVNLVERFSKTSSLNIKLISARNATVSGKKGMLALGLRQVTGSLIIQTDGDCRVGSNWLRLLEYTYISKKAKFISGPVGLVSDNSFFGRMQVTEFASLIGSGAASISLGFPNMCNGANLAFEKAAFETVNGYNGNENIASGDDEFLMHKIHKQFPGSVTFLKSREAIVKTPVQSSISGFLNQRLRWASKWKFYNNLPAQLIGLLIFGVNLLLFMGLFLWASGIINTQFFWPLYLLKSTVDFVFLALVLKFLQQGRYILYFLPWQLVYLPYVIYCALAGLHGKYNWKGRTLKNP
jgi:biofilm PGA synthesis N-glycosyltransferase PgaC